MAECWSGQRQTQQETEATSKEVPEMKTVICYNCSEVGHKSTMCPKPRNEGRRKRDDTNRVQTFSDDKGVLRKNEILATIGDESLPMTIDTGASVMVLPMEFVPSSDRTGNTIQITEANGDNISLQK